MVERNGAGEYAVSNSLFTDIVTVYHKIGDRFARQVISGVQWRQKIERLNDDGKLTLATVTSVTIPGDISVNVNLGDVIVLGVGPELSAGYSIANLRADHSTYCTVRAVADNTLRAHLKHRKVIAV